MRHGRSTPKRADPRPLSRFKLPIASAEERQKGGKWRLYRSRAANQNRVVSRRVAIGSPNEFVPEIQQQSTSDSHRRSRARAARPRRRRLAPAWRISIASGGKAAQPPPRRCLDTSALSDVTVTVLSVAASR